MTTQILGWVTAVQKEGNFVIQNTKGVKLRISCPFYCPVEISDAVFATVSLEDNGSYKVVSPPFFQIPVDSNHIKDYLIRAFRGGKTRMGEIEADNLYKKLLEISSVRKHEEKSKCEDVPFNPVADYLTEYAILHERNRYGKAIKRLSMAIDIEEEDIDKLLRFWYKKWSIRRLYLLALNNAEIDGCHMSLIEIYEKAITNPFYLSSVPIEKAIQIYTSMGKVPDAIQLLCGKMVRKIYYCMEKMSWTVAPMWLLHKEFNNIHSMREILIKDYDVTFENESAYLPYGYKVETKVTKYINDKIIHQAKRNQEIKDNPVPKFPESTPIRSCKTLTEEQERAIAGSLENEISIITGQAGSGKSTIIREIIESLKKRKKKFAVTSFTGKAVSRIDEILNCRAAFTMDLMIRQQKSADFEYLIIDETSMVTVELFYRFITAFPGDYKIIFVGDINQLPPVGWGELMSQLIYTDRIPIYTLTTNHRIERKSDDQVILKNANLLIEKTRDMDKPVSFFSGQGFGEIEGNFETIRLLLTQLKASGVDKDDIVIISPYNKPIQDLNSLFQEIFLGDILRVNTSDGRVWIVGDRVMMIKNNYEIGIMNGETGNVVGITEKGIVVIFKDGKERLFLYQQTYNKYGDPNNKDLVIRDLVHSFSITTHKSQGSEYKIVIVYIAYNPNPGKFLNQNLLYTSFTRAKQMLWCVGSLDTIHKAGSTIKSRKYDNLCRRLRELRDLILEPIPVKEDSSIPEEVFDDYDDCGHDDFGSYD